MTALITLLCGPRDNGAQAASDMQLVLNHLSESLSEILHELDSLKTADDKKLRIYGPFLGRSWLEVAFTALIGRLDPFRILTIRRTQLSNGYDRTMPWKCAIRWQGDVLSSRPKDLWAASHEPKDLTRAVLGDYYDELYWRPALQALSDAVPMNHQSRWLTELLGYPGESFSPRKRESVNSLYSELSKSVHFESVTPSAALADRISIVELIQRCVRETAEVALLSHFVAHSFSNIDISSAVVHFASLEEMEVVQ